MKKNWLVACAMVMGISSCVDSDKDLYQDPGMDIKEVNTSDFSTKHFVQIEIDYSEADAKVPFSIYDENPLIYGEDGTVSLKDIDPLDAAWTDENGKFTDNRELPAYASKVYILTKAFYAKMLMEGEVINGVLKVSDTDGAPAVSRASDEYRTSTRTEEGRFASLGWLNKLGTFDDKGKVKYAYTGKNPKLTLTSEERENLKETIYSVLNTTSSCPKDYRREADLYIEKSNTAIVLTALGGWTCWNNSLGYYYYKKDAGVPKSIKDVNVYTVFPNTQTGSWKQGSFMSSPLGLQSDKSKTTAVQLKYFGDNGDQAAQDFPAGYCIGFVLACNAWDEYFTGYGTYTATKGYLSCSTKGFSSLGHNKIDVHTAMFKEKETGNIAIAFEDFNTDENFTDVLFALKADPEITNVPEVDPDLNTTIEKKGVYAFEDKWPSAYDYDMNDVLVQYSYQKTFNTNNEILNEAFTFKTIYNQTTTLTNGLGISLSNETSGISTDSIKNAGEKKFTENAFSHDGNVVILANSVKTNPNAEYKLTRTYGENSTKKQETTVDAFIFRPSKNDARLEVHIPMQRPTSKVDMSFFGTQDDRSKPEQNIYYVSDKDNIYPFAFYLSNANTNDIEELMNFNKNEGVKISDLYPKFIEWAKDNSKSADWYKKK